MKKRIFGVILAGAALLLLGGCDLSGAGADKNDPLETNGYRAKAGVYEGTAFETTFGATDLTKLVMTLTPAEDTILSAADIPDDAEDLVYNDDGSAFRISFEVEFGGRAADVSYIYSRSHAETSKSGAVCRGLRYITVRAEDGTVRRTLQIGFPLAGGDGEWEDTLGIFVAEGSPYNDPEHLVFTGDLVSWTEITLQYTPVSV